MFDTGLMVVAAGRVGVSELRASTERLGARPAGSCLERVAVVGPLQPLLPEGLVPGSTVAVFGSTSLALALVAGVAGDDWVAGVGWEPVGLAAAHELGARWERLVLVAISDRGSWATAVSVLLEGFDLVMVRTAGGVAGGDARRLAARARERGSVLIVAGPPAVAGAGWPVSDVRLRVVESWWEGLGVGHGYLRGRRVVVEASGRGRLSRPRRVGLWLPAPSGGVCSVEETSVAAPGPTDHEVMGPRREEVS